MDLLGFLGAVVAISLSGVMSPGPLTAITLALGRRDAWAGLWINIGHAIAEVPLILALLYGLGPLVEEPLLRRGVALLGGLLLFGMGAGLLRGRERETDPPDSPAPRGGPVLSGAGMTALNPYWFLWWLTVGLGLITRAQAFGSARIVALMVAVHLACDLGWGTFLSWAAHRGGRGMGPPTWRRIEIGCGLVLILFGGFFFYEGIGAA